MPLLHPAQVLGRGDVRAAAGFSAQIVTAGLDESLDRAKSVAASGAELPGPPGSNDTYARGALVAAAVAPGLNPFVGARVGLGGGFEGGLTYTGRGGRVDGRRAFSLGTSTAFSLGAGLNAAFYGQTEGGPLPHVELGTLRGFGFDVPVLVGYETAGGLYRAWAGVRGGFEHDRIGPLTSEPRPGLPSNTPELVADRSFVGGLVGVAAGLGHVHAALELSVAYQSAVGRFNETRAHVSGLTLSPAAAVWWTF